jgi:hypothetical protein
MTDEASDEGDDRTLAPAQKQEKVEDRPNVSTVEPEDYPQKDRASGKK